MAEGVLPPIVLELKAKASELHAELGKVKGEVDELGHHAEKSGSTFNRGFQTMAGAGKAITFGLAGAAIAVGGFALESASAAQVVDAKLATAVKNAGGSMEEMDPKIAQVDSRLRNFGFTNDQTNTALATLTVATKDPQKALDSMGVAADLARAKNIDLNTASLMVAKAMEGQTRPLKALGIDLPVYAGNAQNVKLAQLALANAQQKVTDILAKTPGAVNPASKAHASYEKALRAVKLAHEKLAETQSSGKQIMAALEQRVHGMASAYGNTLAGKMAAAKAQVENIGEALGKRLIPLVTAALGAASKFIGWLNDHTPVLYTIAGVIGGVMVAAIGAYIATQVKAAYQTAKSFAEAIGKAGVWAATKLGLYTQVSTAAEASAAAEVAATEEVSAAEEAGATVAEDAGAAQALAFGPIGIAIMAVIAVAILLATHWKQVWGAIKVAFSAVWDFLKTAFGWIKDIFFGYIKLELTILKAVWGAVWGAIKTVVGGVWDFLKSVWGWISSIFGGAMHATLSGLGSVFSAVWGGIRSVVGGVWGFLQGVWGGIQSAVHGVGSVISWLGGIFSSIFGGIESAVQGAWSVISGIFNAISGAVSSVVGAIGSVVDAAKSVGGAIGSVGHFLGFDNGGVVPGPKGAPRLAVVHGGEYVLSNDMLAGRQEPTELLKAQSANGYRPASAGATQSEAALTGGSSSPGGMGGQQINVYAQTNASPRRIAMEIGWVQRGLA